MRFRRPRPASSPATPGSATDGAATSADLPEQRWRTPGGPDRTRTDRFVRFGRVAWSVVGIALAAYIISRIAGRLSVIVIPLVLALFPAALVSPLNRLLRRWMPNALAAMLTIVVSIGVLVGAVSLLVPVVADEIPALRESVSQAVQDLQTLLDNLPFGLETASLLDRAQDQLGSFSQQIAQQALSAAVIVVEGVAGLLLGLVALFFYLKDGARISGTLCSFLPAPAQRHADALGGRAWDSISGYIRGQLLIALIDAILIGIGLVVLRVPLALPLAVLVFVGGLFPIVGAFVSGLVAVLVGLASGGLTTALLVLALVVVVQQVEGDVLAPIVFGSTVSLHPLVVLIALGIGAVLLGILGAFLAVPVAAAIARAVDYARTPRAAADGTPTGLPAGQHGEKIA